jgi:predicted membrane protein
MNCTPRIVVGVLLIILGALFLLDNFGYLNAADVIVDLWPLLIVLLGIALLVRGRRMPAVSSSQDKPVQPSFVSTGSSVYEDSAEVIVRSELLRDIKIVPTSRNFAGASCNTVFGDIRMDLSNVELKTGEHMIRLSTVFGDVKVDIPENLQFSSHASTLIGDIRLKGNKRTGFGQALAFKTQGYDQAGKKITIILSSVFGDVKIY